MESTQRTHRERNPIRSKTGCETCRIKKVKCDEQRWVCGRCDRLRLKCEWERIPTARQKTKAKRKEANGPKKILPHIPSVTTIIPPSAASEDFLDIGILTEAVDFRENDHTYLESFNSPRCTTPLSEGPNWSQRGGFLTDFRDVGIFDAQDFLSAPVLDQSFEKFPLPDINYSELDALFANFRSPLDVLDSSTSMRNIALSPSFEVSAKEKQALHHYREYLSTYTSTKNIQWSSHMVMLCYASHTPMLMHLLLAASLMDLTVYQRYDKTTYFAAQQHFRAGASLLIGTINSHREPDHVSVLMAFFFLYEFRTKQKYVDVNATTQLSNNVCDYIKRYNLDTLAVRSTPFSSTRLGVVAPTVLPRDKRECLARLIVWLFYEDVGCVTQGYGGSLASHLRRTSKQTDEIYQQSTTMLESTWGSEYPEREIVDDLENGPILKFLYDVMKLYTDVNNACQHADGAAAEVDKIEESIIKLEEGSRFLFRLTAMTTKPRPRLMLNADFMVSYFWALRIYKFRCFLRCDEASATPPEILSCLNSILTVAQRTFSTGYEQQTVERFQWALFMAGIETADSIHREWIAAKMHRARLRSAFERILDMQSQAGRRVSISIVRQVICDGEIIPVPRAIGDQQVLSDHLETLYTIENPEHL